MHFRTTGCCGISEITGLSQHLTAQDAVDNFCQQVFGVFRATGFGGFRTPDSAYFYTYYMFTAAVYNRPDYNLYGEKFAALIEQKGLGKVTTIPAEVNFQFHADHKVQAWLWQPNREALRTWWETKTKLEHAQHMAALKRQAAGKLSRSDAAKRAWIVRRAKMRELQTLVVAEHANNNQDEHPF